MPALVMTRDAEGGHVPAVPARHGVYERAAHLATSSVAKGEVFTLTRSGVASVMLPVRPRDEGGAGVCLERLGQAHAHRAFSQRRPEAYLRVRRLGAEGARGAPHRRELTAARGALPEPSGAPPA